MSTAGGYRPIDSKREEFRKYLERAGVMDALTKVLVMLYEEVDKPQDALEFVIKNLIADRPEAAEIDNLRSGIEILQVRVQELENQKAALIQRLSQYEPVDQEEEGEGGEEADGRSEPPAPPPTDAGQAED